MTSTSVIVAGKSHWLLVMEPAGPHAHNAIAWRPAPAINRNGRLARRAVRA